MTNYIANFTLSEPETINATFKIVTVTEATGLSYNDLDNRPSINDITLTGNKTSTDLGLAAQSTTYTKNEVDTLIDSIPTPDVSGQISAHNTSNIAHSDIRTLISNEVTRAQSVESTKADKTTTYTKTEVDSKISAIPTPDVSAQITSHNSSETAHSDIRTALSNKVDKSGTKQLSDENYTNDEKTKLSGIEAGAQVNPDLTSYAKTVDVNTALSGKSDTSHNHTLSGLSEKSYNSLTDKPTIPTQYTDAMAQSALSAQLATKVDKATGKSLVSDTDIAKIHDHSNKTILDNTTASFTTAKDTLLAQQSGTNTGDEDKSRILTKLGTSTLSGLIKMDGAGNSSAAVAGTDYLTPNGNGSQLTGITQAQISGLKAYVSDNFLPPNSIFTVGATGDFATLQACWNYFSGKWSSGAITVNIQAGTYPMTTIDLSTSSFSFPKMVINGEGIAKTELNFSSLASYAPAIRFYSGYTPMDIRNLTISGSSSTKYGQLISVDSYPAFLKLFNVGFAYGEIGLCAVNNNCILLGVTYNYLTDTAIIAAGNGGIATGYGMPITISNSGTGLKVRAGGNINLFNTTPTFTNVTTQYGSTLNTLSSSGGVIAYSI